MTPPVRVVVDARLEAGEHGGVESVVAGLAQGFAELRPSDVDVRFVVLRGRCDWLLDRVPGARYLEVDRPSLAGAARRKSHGVLRRSGHRLNVRLPTSVSLPPDPAVDRLGADVVHYPFQHAARSKAPFIYQPHDLQHLHLPQFFTPAEIAAREAFYPAMCRASAAVAVSTRWVKDDLLAHYDLAADHIVVIPLAPPGEVVEADPHASIDLPERYLLYPAVNWPHKNHARLIEAVGLAKVRGHDLALVLTGAIDDSYPDPRVLAAAAGVADRVHVLGYVDQATLSTVYSRALGVVVPTLFEAASFPIWEAFTRGVPVACSTVTSLPDQVADNAVLFDPMDVAAIAGAMTKLWDDEDLRVRLAAGGRQRVAAFTWRQAAEGFAALYRRVAGRTLSEFDRAVLSGDVELTGRGVL